MTSLKPATKDSAMACSIRTAVAASTVPKVDRIPFHPRGVGNPESHAHHELCKDCTVCVVQDVRIGAEIANRNTEHRDLILAHSLLYHRDIAGK
jgi:hypothetical protein